METVFFEQSQDRYMEIRTTFRKSDLKLWNMLLPTEATLRALKRT